MNAQHKIAAVTLWVNRAIAAVVAAMIFALPALIGWYRNFRSLTDSEQTAITAAFYCCALVIFIALWNMERLLSSILQAQVFVKQNVRRLRRIQWCCGVVSLICLPSSFIYVPLIFIVIIMAFLCLCVAVVGCVMDAAVAIREENDLTI